ncbi:hypothetical protein BRADI_3g17971v3 [Brachypodium distachyon]|uniref:Uncharacterized protein n=1 Tax=Brachypodium distachyon TaxID=15368 RepID=A0A2K2CXZ3_BRADI|nr:hypothetical protein BRADI_3g17971v3 [Brachypodium distachyon]
MLYFAPAVRKVPYHAKTIFIQAQSHTNSLRKHFFCVYESVFLSPCEQERPTVRCPSNSKNKNHKPLLPARMKNCNFCGFTDR